MSSSRHILKFKIRYRFSNWRILGVPSPISYISVVCIAQLPTFVRFQRDTFGYCLANEGNVHMSTKEDDNIFLLVILGHLFK